MRYAVAHGRRAGRGRGAGLAAAATARLRAAGHDVVEIAASSHEEAHAAATAARDAGVDVLVAVGGDGVVSTCADVCAGTGATLGIVPAGTGNDAARSLGIPVGAAAVDLLLTGAARPLDTLEVVELDRHVIGSVLGALDARIAHRATRLPRRLGAATYTVATLVEIALLTRQEPLHHRLRIDGTLLEVDALVVVAANTPYVGGGLQVAPPADPHDGELDLVIIRPVGVREALGLLRAVRAGSHAEHPRVELHRAREVVLDGPGDVLAHGDGEPLAGLPLTVRTAASSLRVITPALA